MRKDTLLVKTDNITPIVANKHKGPPSEGKSFLLNPMYKWEIVKKGAATYLVYR